MKNESKMEKLFNQLIKNKKLFHWKFYQRYDAYHEGEEFLGKIHI